MLDGDMSTAADTQPGTWITVGVLVGLALALLVGVLVSGVLRARRLTRARRAATPAPAPVVEPGPTPAPVAGFPDDDLPGFLDQPPGWVAGPAPQPAEPVTAPAQDAPRTGSTAAVAPPSGDHGGPGRGDTLGLATSAALLVAAVVVAFVGGSAGTSPAADASVASPPGPATAAAPTSEAPVELTDTAAGALALTSVPLTGAGVAATATYGALVLEQRAVGLTVTRPGVSVSTDGRRSLAHVRLPTYNCLTAEPPADPATANCVPTITEYADLASPGLQVTRTGDRVELGGSFATYTRPNGGPPVYTGRTYQLTADITPAGPRTDGVAPATGVVRIGVGSAPAVPEPGVNRLQYP
jgi:hypothetical protein